MNPDNHLVVTDSELVIAKGGGERKVFFPDIVRTVAGELLVTYYDSREHMHTPDSRIMLVRGSGDGRQWSAPVPLLDHAGLDDRDPSITQLRSGRLVLTWFRRDPSDLDRERHCMVMTSDDDGATWTEPAWIPTALDRSAVTVPPLELPDGRLLLALYGYTAEQPDGPYVIRLSVSTDQGQTWGDEITVPAAQEPYGLVEPDLVHLGGQDLLMVARSRDHPRNAAHALWSTDLGATWTDPVELDFPGHAPNLVPLGEARVLMTWGDYQADEPRTRPTKGRVVDGHDRALAGATLTLHAHPGVFDQSYPSAARLDDGSYLVVHYDAELRRIAGTIVTI